MKAKNYFIMVIMACFFIISCKESKMEEVMAIHDEVMPKMGTIGKMVGELSELENDSTTIGKEYQLARKDLQDAHKSMMDWMQGFGDRFDPDEILNGKELSTQKQKWLDEEEEKVKVLRDQINKSIKKAKMLLESGK